MTRADPPHARAALDGHVTLDARRGAPRLPMVRSLRDALTRRYQHMFTPSDQGKHAESLPDVTLDGEQLLVSGRERELALVRVEAQPVQNAP